MQRLTSLFAAALLCGCAVGPDFRVPAPPDDAGYVPGPQPVASVAAESANAIGTPAIKRMAKTPKRSAISMAYASTGAS